MESIELILQEVVIPFLKGKSKKGSNIEPYKGYNKIVSQYNRVLVHSQKDEFPKELFLKQVPNETQEEYKYRYDNFKQITIPVFVDYINTVTRFWHDANWDIQYKDDAELYAEKGLRDYLEYKMPTFGNIFNFYQNIRPILKTKDPNGITVVKPKRILYKEVDGENRVNEDVLFEPAIFYYSCKNVLHYTDNECMYITHENSYVIKEGKRVKEGYVLEYHSENEIWQIVQVGKYQDFIFEINLILQHNYGYKLVNRLGGLSVVSENEVYYESPFLSCVDNLDLALFESSNLLIAETKGAYPVRVMLGNECDFENNGARCTFGKLLTPNEDGLAVISDCPSCNGTGLKNRISPNGELLFNGKDLSEQGINSNDLLKYVAPSREILDFLRERIQENINYAKAILHLNRSNDKANVNEPSATLSNLENKALMSFISMFARQEFDALERDIDAIGYLRYGQYYQKPNINRAVNFDFTTENDYLELIKTIRDSNAPSIVLRNVMYKYLNSLYYTDGDNVSILNLIVTTDRLFEYNDMQVNTMYAQGLAQDYELYIHSSGINLIQELYANDKGLFEKDLEEQKNLLIELAKSKVNTNDTNITDVLA
jgi:hypothetical protein